MYTYYTHKSSTYVNCLFLVEILSGGESEGGSAEETVCQETQTTTAVSNSHGDVEKPEVRYLLTLSLLNVTKTEFLLTISMQYQAGR